MMDLKNKINSLLNPGFMAEMLAIRRHLHMHPELSFQEKETSAFIRRLLEEWEIPYDYPFVDHGILARLRGKHPGKVLALRADMDALPIHENSGEEFASVHEGIMHACGHDVHMTCMLGAIRILSRLRDEIRGEILFVFQPGEEKLPGGAKLMLEEGVFAKRRPDLILAQHVLPDMEAGKVGFRPGIYMASSDEIYIRVRGKGGHGALRHLLRDPILMASRILLDLQEKIMAAAPEDIPTVLSFGKVQADGATNVVPDEVWLEGTFRTMDEAWREQAHGLMKTIAGDIAAAAGGSVDMEVRKGYPVLYNNEGITRSASHLAMEFLGRDKVENMEIRMTAEDFAWFTQSIPGMMYRLGIKGPGWEKSHALHTASFTVDESAVHTGISLMSYLAIEMLKGVMP